MLGTLDVQKSPTDRLNILIVDGQDEISNGVITEISRQLEPAGISKEEKLPLETSSYNCLFYFIDGYDKKVINSLEKLYNRRGDDPGLNILLVHKSCTDKELFPYLHYPVNGIVSLRYLKNHCKTMMDLVKEKGVFIEPCLHRDLVNEIERKKLRDQPIDQLVLNKDLVDGILTNNEQDVLQLILDGHNNQKIAEKLYLAPSTISTIISHLLKKVKANDRTHAMVTAIKNGWVEARR
ncbi:LuxR C-terminal-related transcriptional regulator [Evansella sp. LMS18]|uniref:response regulator transcription factor n=1 Tax=Evansella sp. LMS18 TaxID=2924033 RepID=UPI0020D1D2DD|nr:LuxR C-terminal-related transcriptional regulator [Evansella sp. LMS18]UTR11778.1 LuxR C-terminal-related transcriptional regulator [Evansella sp. LMS18]